MLPRSKRLPVIFLTHCKDCMISHFIIAHNTRIPRPRGLLVSHCYEESLSLAILSNSVTITYLNIIHCAKVSLQLPGKRQGLVNQRACVCRGIGAGLLRLCWWSMHHGPPRDGITWLTQLRVMSTDNVTPYLPMLSKRTSKRNISPSLRRAKYA